jgi:hypothetical protein
MKHNPTLLLLGVIPLLASCAIQPIALAPVGPGPFPSGAAADGKGDLQVYTETQEFYDNEMSYYPHTDYELYTRDGRFLKHVWNHQDHADELPATVSLAPGEYVVRAWADLHGLVEVPVEIQPGQTTHVVLQPGWKPGGVVPKTDLVQIPNGYFVGWRAHVPSGP